MSIMPLFSTSFKKEFPFLLITSTSASVYICSSISGILIHADLQAVYNIIKKAVPEAFANGIEGIGLYPRSLSINQMIKMITSKGGC